MLLFYELLSESNVFPPDFSIFRYFFTAAVINGSQAIQRPNKQKVRTI